MSEAERGEMVLKVAKAIFASRLIPKDYGPWPEHSTVTRTFCLQAAHAAIEAMREPTRAMLEVPVPDMPAGGSAEEIWRDMIDAALNEKTPAQPLG